MALRTSEQSSTDDTESESPNKTDWASSSDGLNPVDDFYKKKLGSHETAQELQNAENAGGDGLTDSEDIGDQEGNPEPIPISQRKKGKTRFNRIKKAVKKGGPTGGIIGLIVTVFFGGSIFLGPASLLVNLSSILGNHSDLGKHLFTKTGNSYMASLLKGEGRNCATSKIKCKFTTVSEKRIKQWESRGIKVDYDKNPTRLTGHYKVRGLEYKNKKVETIRQFKSLRYTNPEFNSQLKRFPVRAGYINTKSSINKSLAKFGNSLASKFASSKKKDKAERKAENGKKMNSLTKAKEAVGVKITKAMAPHQEKLKSFGTSARIASGVSAPTVLGCMAYNIIRAAQAATTLYWHSELIVFSTKFLQAGAQAKEAGVNGEFEWQTAEYFGDRLTQPITREMAEEDDNDNITLDMVGRTAMDSKGVAAALNGDTVVNEDYAGWKPSVWGIGAVKEIQDHIGKDNIRNTCILSRATLQAASAPACIASLPKCALAFAGFFIVANVWGDDIIEAITKQIQSPALELIAKANLSDSLVGPPLGDALTSGAGVLGSYMDRSSGFAVANNNDQAYQAYNYMMTDEDYIQSEIADAKQKASANQFDPTNKYSFAGQFASKFSSVPWDGTLLSVMKNMSSAVAGLSDTSHAAKDGMFMPIETYKSKQNFNDTIAKCKDLSLNELNIPCMGESGRTVPYILPDVQECLDKEQNDNSVICIEKAIDHLSLTAKYGSDKTPFIDKDTGKPSDWENYGKYKEDKKNDNPFLMFMAYCGSDREYPLGYTNGEIESDDDDWHLGINCASDPKNEHGNINDTDLGWMSYYYNMCIALLASEEDQDYCWEESKAPTNNLATCGVPSTPTDGDFSSSSGTNGHRIILVHTTEGDSYGAMANALRSKGLSYTIAIDEDGNVSRLVSDDVRAIGAKSANNDSLQVALVGNADEGDRLDANSIQMKTLSSCIADWSKAYNIPLEHVTGAGILNGGSAKGVAGHGDVANADPAAYAGNGRTDPGVNFPWSEVLANAKK